MAKKADPALGFLPAVWRLGDHTWVLGLVWGSRDQRGIDGLEGVLWRLEHEVPEESWSGVYSGERKTKGDLAMVCGRGKVWAGWRRALQSCVKGKGHEL